MLSVIMPVYQAAQHLRRSANSVLNQSYKDLELILIDDGSNDDSGRICDTIASSDNRVKCIHTINCGPFQARKTGVEIAKGDMITFVDADDYLELDLYENIFDVYRKYKPDIFMFTYRYNKDGEIVKHNENAGFYDKNAMINIIEKRMMWDPLIGGRRIDPSLCCKIIKTDLFRKVTSNVTDRITQGSDAVVTYPLICASDSMYISEICGYHYCVRENSVVRSYPVDRINELKNLKKNLEELLGKYGVNEEYSYQIDCYLRCFIEALLLNWFGCSRSSQMYSFPFKQLKYGEKIKLYGAGKVGRSYYATIKQTEYVNLSGWFDEKAELICSYDSEPIKSISDIELNDGERLLIAVGSKRVYENIRDVLKEKGIDEDRIVWDAPKLIG